MSETPQTYQVKLKPSVRQWLNKTEPQDRRRLLPALEKLSRPNQLRGVKALAGSKSYRLRVGNFRIVYEVSHEQVLVLVIRIDHRSRVYRD